MPDDAKFCGSCGSPMDTASARASEPATERPGAAFDAQPRPGDTAQPVVVNTIVRKESNGVGVAGFVLAILSVVFSWTGPIGWLVWFLGALLSVIGLFRKPHVWAIIGFVISFIDLIILVAVFGALSAMF